MVAHTINFEKEMQIVTLLVQGVSCKQICKRVKVGERTVRRYRKKHQQRILNKIATEKNILDRKLVARALLAASVEMHISSDEITNSAFYLRARGCARESRRVVRARAYAALAIRTTLADKVPVRESIIAEAVGATEPVGYMASLDYRLRRKTSEWWNSDRFMRILAVVESVP